MNTHISVQYTKKIDFVYIVRNFVVWDVDFKLINFRIEKKKKE